MERKVSDFLDWELQPESEEEVLGRSFQNKEVTLCAAVIAAKRHRDR